LASCSTPTAAHDPGHQPAAGEHVDHRRLLGELDGVVPNRERIAELEDLDALGGGRDEGRHDVDAGRHAEGRVVVLVGHHGIEADLFGELVVLEALAVEPAAGHGIEEAVGEEEGGVAGMAGGVVVGMGW
jgi:hypothetical protein